jgi:hypothetical protein
VEINELVTGVNIALNGLAADTCPALDANASGQIEINELVTAVNHALAGCPVAELAAPAREDRSSQ